MALHPKTGKIWVHEHGPQGGDEINILKSGANYGWPKTTFGEQYGGGKIGIGPKSPGRLGTNTNFPSAILFSECSFRPAIICT